MDDEAVGTEKKKKKSSSSKDSKKEFPPLEFPPWIRGFTVRDFIERLLHVDPRRRMTAVEALAHPWISPPSGGSDGGGGGDGDLLGPAMHTMGDLDYGRTRTNDDD